MNESLQFQINFFKDHTKIILCPLMGAVTYIDDQRQHRTFSFELIEKHGEYWIYACYVKQYIEKFQILVIVKIHEYLQNYLF